jgi:hypothetical protein
MPKRIIFFMCCLILILSACNLPLNVQATEENVDLIATQVANLLTLTPQIASPESISTQPTAEENNTKITLTAEPEVSSTPTATITTTPTPAGIPTGPANWSDPLNNGSRFGIDSTGYDDGNTIIQIENGAMKLTSLGGNGWRGWRLTSQNPNNYYLKSEFTTETCAGNDQYGMIVQAPNFDSGYGYYFGLTCDGRFSIQRWDSNGLSTLAGWDQNTSINSGSDQTNTISILKSGNRYEYFINEVSVANVEDSTFANPGYFGPFISGLATNQFSIQLEEINYWNLP